MDVASVLDLSAVVNDVQVLGENTIRYEAPGANSGGNDTPTTTPQPPGIENETPVTGNANALRSASGVLAATGMHMSDTITAFWVLFIGLFLSVGFRRKRSL